MGGNFSIIKSNDEINKNGVIELFNKIIEELESEKYVKETLAKGEKKFMGISKLHRHKTNRRLDMIYTKKENYPFALLYFTGSGQFNVEMRNHAISLGYSLIFRDKNKSETFKNRKLSYNDLLEVKYS